MYRALITDLDGTVIPIGGDGNSVDAKTKLAVAAAIKAGYKMACATGRDYQLLGSVVKELGFIDPCIISGGSRIIDPVNGSVLWEKTLEPGAGQGILDIFKQHTRDAILITSARDDRPSVDQVKKVPKHLVYIYLLNVPLPLAKVIRDQVNELPDSIAHLTPSWYGDSHMDIHVTHAEVTKSHAMKIWHGMVGVTVAETIGVGDSGNDLPLFKSAGLKVAVGNSTAELKELADYIAPPVDEHALVHVIDQFLLKQN